MVLYVYDHCPYCVKARMIFGLKKQPVQLKTFLNDDEKTPISMIGLKMVPILEYQPGKFMPESMDIVSYIDKLKGPAIVKADEDPKLQNWMDKNRETVYRLAMPRWVKADLGEFKTPGARKYFQDKKTGFIGPFDECLKDSPQLIAKMEQELKILEEFFQEEQAFFKSEPSFNDFHLFPFLRSLSIVKALEFPKKVQNYMEKLAKASQVPLHQDIAQ